MIEGFVPVPNGPIQNIDYWNSVSGKYFETIGAHLLEGRLLNDGDGAASPFVVAINQTMAAVPTAEADAPTFDNGEIEDRPSPVPKASRMTDNAAVTNAPPITAAQDTPDEFASFL